MAAFSVFLPIWTRTKFLRHVGNNMQIRGRYIVDGSIPSLGFGHSGVATGVGTAGNRMRRLDIPYTPERNVESGSRTSAALRRLGLLKRLALESTPRANQRGGGRESRTQDDPATTANPRKHTP